MIFKGNVMMWQLKAAVLAAVLATAPAPGAPVQPAAEARSQTVSFNIAAQPLGKALNEFGRQTGLQVVFFYGDIREGLTAPALKGNYTAKVALERLLAN